MTREPNNGRLHFLFTAMTRNEHEQASGLRML